MVENPGSVPKTIAITAPLISDEGGLGSEFLVMMESSEEFPIPPLGLQQKRRR
jgi:hypothetical protein